MTAAKPEATKRLEGGNGSARSELLADLLALALLLATGDSLGLGSEVELDVRGGGLVLVDTAVSAVGAAAVVGGLVDLGVGDHEVLDVHGLGIGVGLGVGEEAEEELGSLLGVATRVSLDLLARGVAADTVVVLGESNDLLVRDDVLEVGLSAAEGHAADGGAGGKGVLEGNADASGARLGDLLVALDDLSVLHLNMRK